MSGGIAEILGKERRIHLFDSFEGLPPAKEVDGKEAIAWQKDVTSPTYFDNCKAEEAFALSAMKMAGHENFRTYKGWFNATLATYENRPIGILRLDGDWYESVRDCLDHLYPHVVQGGLIVLDDYYAWDGCAKAAHDFLSATHSASRIHKWRDAVAYIVKKE